MVSRRPRPGARRPRPGARRPRPGARRPRPGARRRCASAVALCLAAAAPARALEVKPYGFVLVNAIEHWNRPNILDIPTQARSTDDANTKDAYNAFHARQTRAGLTAKGIEGPGASQVSATAEMDFWGNRASGTGGNDVLQSAPRLRLAYIQFQWERQALVLGQDWIKAFSPLSPSSLMHQAIPAMHNSGNLWNRVPQARWEGRFEPEGLGAALNARAALARAFSADQAGGGTVSQLDQPGSGESSGGPAYQALLEAARKIDGRDFVFGVSGQYLRQGFRTGVVAPPAGAVSGTVGGLLGSVHAVLPFCRFFEISGEGFAGRSDAGLQGLGQVYADGTAIRASMTRGGWVQATLKPASEWKVELIEGGEKVNETGLAAGSVYRNETLMANAIWDFSKELSFSAEYGIIRTYFVGKAAGRTHNLGLAAMVKFGG